MYPERPSGSMPFRVYDLLAIASVSLLLFQRSLFTATRAILLKKRRRGYRRRSRRLQYNMQPPTPYTARPGRVPTSGVAMVNCPLWAKSKDPPAASQVNVPVSVPGPAKSPQCVSLILKLHGVATPTPVPTKAVAALLLNVVALAFNWGRLMRECERCCSIIAKCRGASLPKKRRLSGSQACWIV